MNTFFKKLITSSMLMLVQGRGRAFLGAVNSPLCLLHHCDKKLHMWQNSIEPYTQNKVHAVTGEVQSLH